MSKWEDNLEKHQELFSSSLFSKLTNKVIKKGKKEKARKIVFNAIDYVAKENSLLHKEILEGVLKNLKPSFEIKRKKRGSSVKLISIKISEKRAISLVFSWLIEYAKKRKKIHTFSLKLGNEILDGYLGKGEVYKKKERINEEVKKTTHIS